MMIRKERWMMFCLSIIITKEKPIILGSTMIRFCSTMIILGEKWMMFGSSLIKFLKKQISFL